MRRAPPGRDGRAPLSGTLAAGGFAPNSASALGRSTGYSKSVKIRTLRVGSRAHGWFTGWGTNVSRVLRAPPPNPVRNAGSTALSTTETQRHGEGSVRDFPSLRLVHPVVSSVTYYPLSDRAHFHRGVPRCARPNGAREDALVARPALRQLAPATGNGAARPRRPTGRANTRSCSSRRAASSALRSLAPATVARQCAAVRGSARQCPRSFGTSVRGRGRERRGRGRPSFAEATKGGPSSAEATEGKRRGRARCAYAQIRHRIYDPEH